MKEMLNNQEKERLRLYVIKELKEDYDLFDIESEMDSSLTYDENINIIADKIELMKEKDVDRDTFLEHQLQKKLDNMKPQSKGGFWRKIIDKVKVVVCIADTGEGKTAWSFKHLQNYSKDVYIYKHPNPKLIEALGYHSMTSLSEISSLTNAVIYFDEPQLSFPKADKRSNETFLLLCSLARQNDITLVFSTSDTRWINKGLESYVSHWIIKGIDVNLIKNGCVVKRIIKQIMPLAQDELLLEKDEYLLYSRKHAIHNGKHKFRLPLYYDDRFSKAYRTSN